MEKRSTNAHLHVLARCTDPLDQMRRALFLLEMLDNVDKARPDARDDVWQRQAWEHICSQGGFQQDLLWGRTSSVLNELAPAGTAMVQLVRTDEDRATVCRYVTKTWDHGLAARKVISGDDDSLEWKELREFHAQVPPRKFAREYQIDQKSGAQILDMDNPPVWKSGGKKLR